MTFIHLFIYLFAVWLRFCSTQGREVRACATHWPGVETKQNAIAWRANDRCDCDVSSSSARPSDRNLWSAPAPGRKHTVLVLSGSRPGGSGDLRRIQGNVARFTGRFSRLRDRGTGAPAGRPRRCMARGRGRWNLLASVRLGSPAGSIVSRIGHRRQLIALASE